MRQAQARPDKGWRRFEIAVADFLTAGLPNARVIHDINLPDAHTGLPRQRDVWIEWTDSGRTWTALASCKRYNRCLNQQDMDHFHGEFLSSGADIGIVFSYDGFNKAALAKAKVLGFTCWSISSDSRGLPSSIKLPSFFHIIPKSIALKLDQTTELVGQFNTWADVLDLPLGEGTVEEELIALFQRFQSSNHAWEGWISGSPVTLNVNVEGRIRAQLILLARCSVYTAPREVMLVAGSYEFTSNSFIGSQATPWINSRSYDPGPAWNPVKNPPQTQPYNSIATIMWPDLNSMLTNYKRQAFPPRTLPRNQRST